MIVVKFGGSLLTDKRGHEAFRPEVAVRAAAELAEVWRERGPFPLVLGHGSGSFGHRAAFGSGVLASSASLDRAQQTEAPMAVSVSKIQDAAARLHRIFVARLLAEDLPVFSLSPSSFLVTRGEQIEGGSELVQLAIDRGLIPVLFGDVVFDRDRGAAILSTESVFEWLLIKAAATGSPPARRGRVLWLGETDGVLDAEGERIDEIEAGNTEIVGRILGTLNGASGVDVTGGIAHRLRSAVRLAAVGFESWILDGLAPDTISQGLRGVRVGGTRVACSPVF